MTYGKIKHIFREDKKETQKVSEKQAERVIDIISKNNVYYDTEKKNIIYISKLPPKEIQESRDWIKIPVDFLPKKEQNIVATMSIIKHEDITKHLRYKKID